MEEHSECHFKGWFRFKVSIKVCLGSQLGFLYFVFLFFIRLSFQIHYDWVLHKCISKLLQCDNINNSSAAVQTY